MENNFGFECSFMRALDWLIVDNTAMEQSINQSKCIQLITLNWSIDWLIVDNTAMEQSINQPKCIQLITLNWSIDWLIDYSAMEQSINQSINAYPIDYPKVVLFQAFCSSVNGTIATQSIMQGLGVGEEATTALAATMTWVLKGFLFPS